MTNWSGSLDFSPGLSITSKRPVAVEIPTNGGFGERVSLTGDDAERFINDVLQPSDDPRRLEHLRRSDETYRRMSSPEPLHDLPDSE